MVDNSTVTDESQGYGADHANIDLLRLRNYTIGTKLTDDQVLGVEGLHRIADLLSCMKPFVSGFLSNDPCTAWM